MRYLVLLIFISGCAMNSASRSSLIEELTREGAKVRVLKKIQKSCRFIIKVQTKLFIEPAHLFIDKKRRDELDDRNYEHMMIRFKNMAVKNSGNSLFDVKVIDEFSNWDRSKPAFAEVYYCE